MDIINYRRPRHRWSAEERRVLCLFTRLYQNDMKDATTVMNHLLAEDLELEGYKEGLPLATVNTQLYAMIEGSYGYNIWRNIHIDLSISEARKRFRETRDMIEDAALILGVSLQLRAQEILKPNTQPRRLGKRARKIEQVRGVLSEHYSSDDDDTDCELRSSRPKRRVFARISNPPVTPRKRITAQLPTPSRSRGTAPRIGRKTSWSDLTGGKVTSVRQNVDEFGNKVRRFPRLLYRYYSSRSQGLNTPTEIRAGMFIDTRHKIPPPEWDLSTVANHLIPEKRLSPYISFRESMLSCVYNTLKEDADADARITVIDFQKLKSTSQQWGDDAMQPCRFLINKFKLELGGKKRNYGGWGEWLIYGKVDQAAIVATVKISDILTHAQQKPLIEQTLQLDKFIAAPNDYRSVLKKIRRSPPTMDYQAGTAVGWLTTLMRIPPELREQFAAKVASAWRLRGYEKATTNGLYEDFMNGVFEEEGSWSGLKPCGSRGMEDALDDDQDASDGNSDEAMEGDPIRYSNVSPMMDEQDLIDAQLRMELSSSLGCFENASDATPPSASASNIAATKATSTSAESRLDGWDPFRSSRPSQYAKPRSSSVFTFPRPKIPGPPTDWEATHSRDVSPAPTKLSALNTFTTELLAKAEECSTIGSFGRGPSTTRGVSEVPRVEPEEGRGRGESAEPLAGSRWPEEAVVIDLSSDGEEEVEEKDGGDDDDVDDDVEDLGLEILGSRTINKQG